MKQVVFVLIAAFAAQSCSDPNHTEMTTEVFISGVSFGVWDCGRLFAEKCTANYQCRHAFNDGSGLGGEFSCRSLDPATNSCGVSINVCVRECDRQTKYDDYGNVSSSKDTCGDGYQCNLKTHFCDFLCEDGICMPDEPNVCGVAKDCAYCNDGYCSGAEEADTCGMYYDCRPDQTPHNVPPCGKPDNSCNPDPQPTDTTMTVKACWPVDGIALFEAAEPKPDWKVFGAVSWWDLYLAAGSGTKGQGAEIINGCYTVVATDVEQGFHIDLMKCEAGDGCWGSSILTQPSSCTVDGKPGKIGAYEEGMGWPCLTQSGGVWKP